MTEDFLRKEVYPRSSWVMGRDEIYFSNHSLGRPLDRMSGDVQKALDAWYSRMDGAWEPWQEEMDSWRSNVAKLIGAARADSIVPKTSAGQGLRAVLNSFPQDRPVRVVTSRGEFDSIDFILKTYAAQGRAEVTWVEPDRADQGVPIYTIDPIVEALEGEPGLVVVSSVFFSTSQILQNPDQLIREAHDKGWKVLVDLYHAAGVIPLDFQTLGADFGIGGSYKYLRGGPGACWLALSDSVMSGQLRSLDTGWFAKEDTFGYERSDAPRYAEGGNGWLESTPPILMPYQAKSGIEFLLEIGVQNLREFSLKQQARLRDKFVEVGVPMFQPSDPTQFGAFSLLRSANASELCSKLKSVGLNTDSRGEFVRFGPDLLNSQEEIERAAKLLRTACH